MTVRDFPITGLGSLPVRAAATGRGLRLYFGLLAAVGLTAFVLGVGNRFTSDGLFAFPPPVDWLPPLSDAGWTQAFAIHQQDPIYTACGGTESLAEYKLLYWWEWLRRGSLGLLGVVGGLGLAASMTIPGWRAALPRFAVLIALALAYAGAVAALPIALRTVPDLGRYNVGQYRHVLDAVAASAGLALVLLSVLWPPGPAVRQRRFGLGAWTWLFVILVDIAVGAVFAARDAAANWPTLLGYEGHALPPWPQLVSYSPLWLNLTVNPYAIQLVHRGLSAGLWLVALGWFVWCVVRRPERQNAALSLWLLLTAEATAGIVTLGLGTPAVLSIIHQIGGVLLLVGTTLCLAEPQRFTLRLVDTVPGEAPASVAPPREIVTGRRRASP